MKVLIVDDSLDKLDEVSEAIIKQNNCSSINIDTVGDIQSALLFLQKNDVDLLILDQFLPQRKEQKEDILPNGGKILLQEINRKPKKIITPRYIIGLTQHFEEKNDFSTIWSLLNYSPSETNWSTNLSKIISHINNVNRGRNNENQYLEFKPTIFLEGLTDLTLFQYVLDIFYPEYRDKISLKSQKNAGTNWVAQQMVIWGHMFPKDKGGPIKAVALFDGDNAGNKAREDMLQKLKSSKQQISCKNVQLIPKHSKNLIEFYRIGIKIEIEIESLLPIEILQKADENGWLESRNPMFVETPKDWNPVEERIPEYLNKKGIPEDYLIYLKKVSQRHKEEFIEFVVQECRDDENVLRNLKNLFKTLLKEIF